MEDCFSCTVGSNVLRLVAPKFFLVKCGVLCSYVAKWLSFPKISFVQNTCDFQTWYANLNGNGFQNRPRVYPVIEQKITNSV